MSIFSDRELGCKVQHHQCDDFFGKSTSRASKKSYIAIMLIN